MERRPSLLSDQSGAAAVEMVLVLPFLLALMFMCLEGAHFLYTEHKIVKGVRDGARFAARHPFSKFSCSAVLDTALVTEIQNVTIYGKVSVSGTDKPRVSTWTPGNTSVNVSCPATAIKTGIYENLTNAPRVTVTATVSYPSLFGTLGVLTSSFKVHASDQAAVMGV